MALFETGLVEGCGIPPLPQQQRRGKDGARRKLWDVEIG